jgi:hypothetical protein
MSFGMHCAITLVIWVCTTATACATDDLGELMVNNYLNFR